MTFTSQSVFYKRKTYFDEKILSWKKKTFGKKKSNAILKVFSQTKVINISWRWRDAYHLRCRRFQTDFQRQIPWKLRILFYDNEIIPTISSTYSRIYKTPPTFEKNPGSTFEWIIYWFWNWRTSAPKKRPSFIYIGQERYDVIFASHLIWKPSSNRSRSACGLGGPLFWQARHLLQAKGEGRKEPFLRDVERPCSSFRRPFSKTLGCVQPSKAFSWWLLAKNYNGCKNLTQNLKRGQFLPFLC